VLDPGYYARSAGIANDFNAMRVLFSLNPRTILK
jgi:hypothetical protein